MPLGLITSEATSAYWSQNNRRRIFYDFPNGKAPLTGLLSLQDQDFTPHSTFKWEEQRYLGIQTTTVAGPASTGPFTLTGTTGTAGSPVSTATAAAGQVLRVYVTAAAEFQVDDQIVILGLSLTSGSVDFAGIVREVNTTSNFIEFRVTETPPSTILNTTTSNLARNVIYAGTAFAQGSRSRTGRVQWPYELSNNTQIHKRAFEVCRTTLAEPLKFDKTGVYANIFKTNGHDFLAGLEYANLFGRKGTETTVDADSGRPTRRTMSGGVRYFLDRYEEGSDYGLTNISTQTDWRTYTGKRVIKLGGATISGADLKDLESRIFEKCFTPDYSKLCLCGNGYYNRIETYYEGRIQYESMRNEGYEGFDFKFSKTNSSGGTMYYKTHPLFNDPNMTFLRNSAIYVDLGCLFWRPLTNGDMTLQKMIHARDADMRKDQFLCEAGLEVRFPEGMMYVEDLGGVTR